MENERSAAKPAKRVDVPKGIVNDGRKIPVWEKTRLSAYKLLTMRDQEPHLDIPDECPHLFIPTWQSSSFECSPP